MIFEDTTKNRWKWALRAFIALSVIAVILITNFIISLVTNPPIHNIPSINGSEGNSYQDISSPKPNSTLVNPIPVKPISTSKPYIPKTNPDANHLQNPLLGTFSRTAFFTQGDPKSLRSLKKNIGNLDIVFPDWFRFVKNKSDIDVNIEKNTLTFLKKSKVKVFATISNSNISGNWFGKEFGTYIHDYSNRAALIDLISKNLIKYKIEGINVDVESIDISAKNDYLDFLDELKMKLHAINKYITVDVPMNNEAFDYEASSLIADLVVVMAYDESFPEGAAGPIASKTWFETGVDDILAKTDKKKTIIACGQYAYDWNLDSKEPAKSMSFDEVMLLANDVGAEIETDIDSVNYGFSYIDSEKKRHKVWFLDAVTMWNQVLYSKSLNAAGVAFWRIGLEDPSIWSYYSLKDVSNYNANDLTRVNTLENVNYFGEGEILSINDVPTQGIREFTFSEKYIDYSIYQSIPTSYLVKKYGHKNDKEVVFTFDDGPSSIYTSQILDVLKQYNVKATFFVVGDQAKSNPDILRRMVDEGHLIGNHTYNHINMAIETKEKIKSDLNSVQRLIESATGTSTNLVRPPYNANSSPSELVDLQTLTDLKDLGYILVGADIDPSDYSLPGVDKIVESTMKQLKDTGSNIIVMHDAGGNREQTVEAVKRLIPLLKSNGYKIVNVNDLIGVTPDRIMMKIDPWEQVIIFANSVWLWLSVWGWKVVVVLFLMTTIISVFRILFLGAFVFRSRKKELEYIENTDFEPFVSVLVPSYNEEVVIKKTIDNLLESDYENYEVIVIDDGSTDKTREIVEKLAFEDSRVRLVRKENGGKFTALNLGINEAKYEFLVTIDADTVVLKNTIRNLVMPFKDEKVDAVCGNVQVGNVKNLITGFQAVEYVTTQNYDRRAFDALNCISVVPGATGAWRKTSILAAGGYSGESLTEDADLTLTMLENGGKIVYMPSAKSITEAPEKVGLLYKQRYRWSFGTFQTLWKHRKSFFKGTMGWVALPNVFIFQVLFPILSPIGDVVFILALIRGDMQAIVAGYLLFLAMDLAGSIIAFALEKTPLRYIFLVLIQRFFYRQFMYITTFRAIFAAIKGTRHGWNKLKRTNSVNSK
ncbi:MAG: polysaccharide deacetylase family protein [Bacillota bacterium]